MTGPHVRLVMPHQLFADHLDAPRGTVFVLVEHDLLFRHYPFHAHKLVLHRASMRRFADRLREAGFDVEQVDSGEPDGRTTSRAATTKVLERLRPQRVTAYDVVDDWLARDLTATTDPEWLETPNFLTTRAQLDEALAGRRTRMAQFYSWQRRRLDLLMDGDQPEGGRWSFDEDNRRKLPRDHPVPSVETGPARRHPAVTEAIGWVGERFPDAPGDPDGFAWPTSHDEAETAYDAFLADRFADFGPFEDAVSREHPFLFHSLLTPSLNIGLVDPRHVVDRAIAAGSGVPLNSLEGFVRQVVGWREYMRGTYALHGRRLRSRNHLGHTRQLPEGWWTAETGLEPVDLVIRRVLDRGWAHHIERLMVAGNAMCLLRIDPVAVYEWFMEMFVDAYDWVMVPNVHAMSQFAAGEAITTKPYVSGSNYLRKMTDIPPGEWCEDWDALYWTFVRDHHDVFERNPRSQLIVRSYAAMSAAKKSAHTRRAQPWLA